MDIKMATCILLVGISLFFAPDNAVAAPAASDHSISWKSTPGGQKTVETSSNFSISHGKNPNSTPRLVNATALHVSTLHKYKAPIPENVYDHSFTGTLALESRQETFKLASYFANDIYTVPIQVGTPAQTLYVAFDTGSPDLWVFSSGMPTTESSGHTIYSPAKSSTAEIFTGQTFDIEYGSGSVSGNVYYDVLGIGPQTTISGYPMEAALSVGSAYVSSNLSGIWGVCRDWYQEQTPNEEETWLAFAYYYLDITLFTVNYVYYGTGTITFGTIDSTQYTGSISYSPLVEINGGDSYWSLNTTSFSVGTGTSTTLSEPLILDTGTTFTYVPTSLAAAYWAAVSGAFLNSDGNYYYPCNATLPDLHLNFLGGAIATIHGRYLDPYGLDPNTVAGDTYCTGGLQDNTGLPFTVLGLAIFQSMFVVMDVANSRVGFATKNFLD